ncbi:dehydrogenase/reductase SDR family member 7-like [Littorina saxatilis]|uniref:Dehydrogenase/reductase SDR family member 7 n=1 Tax=Littorina saxatilis TaxID=31220 RepID=A0AAN9GCL4_9CAEN
MILELLVGVAALIVIVQVTRLVLSDCDLTLQWAEKFGKKVGSLKGQVVWVTGASSGIGEALVYRLAVAGCKLVLSARRKEELENVKEQCVLMGPVKKEDILVLPLDSVKFDTHSAAVQTVLKHFGHIDILVNNAGRSQRAAWLETSVEVDRQILEVNVLGVLSLTKSVLPHMKERGQGQVVVTSSVAGKLGAPFSGSYTGSKHALHGWFETLRVEGNEFNLNVTMLCPGPVFSNLLETAFTEQPGKVVGGSMKEGEKRMATERCAELCAVAIANKLDEAWISLQPILISLYAAQYMPTVFRSVMKGIGMKQLRKLREGQE